jgi:hypothetical protein
LSLTVLRETKNKKHKKLRKKKSWIPSESRKKKLALTELFAHKKELQSVPGSGYVVNGVKNGHVD